LLTDAEYSKLLRLFYFKTPPSKIYGVFRGHIYRVFTSRSSDSQLASCSAFYKFQSKHQTGINRPEIYYYLILYSVRTETATNHAKQSGIFGCRSVLSEAKSLRTGTSDLRYHSSLESEFKTVMCGGVLQNGIDCILAGLTIKKSLFC